MIDPFDPEYQKKENAALRDFLANKEYKDNDTKTAMLGVYDLADKIAYPNGEISFKAALFLIQEATEEQIDNE